MNRFERTLLYILIIFYCTMSWWLVLDPNQESFTLWTFGAMTLFICAVARR